MARPGRPDYKWTEEIEAELFKRIANQEAVREICKDDWMPSWSTVNRRLAADADFSARYGKAKEEAADAIFDEMLQISDDARNDWMEQHGEDAVGYKLNGEHIQRSRLRVETRKWVLGKLRPKVYGDKLAIGGADDLPAIKTQSTLDVSGLSLEELHVLEQAILKAAAPKE